MASCRVPRNASTTRCWQAAASSFPRLGCAGLSVRALAEHAGANLGMFHYHFKTKDNFLRTLLQQLLREMFAALEEQARHRRAGDRAAARGRCCAGAALRATNRRVLARVWTDALGRRAGGAPSSCGATRRATSAC